MQEKGFKSLALCYKFAEAYQPLYEKFLISKDHLLITNLCLKKLSSGAYLVDVIFHPQSKCCIFKAKRILHGTLHDLMAHKKREVYYGDYIAVDELIALMRNRTDYLEEKLFIRVHQINEISMQQIIITL